MQRTTASGGAVGRRLAHATAVLAAALALVATVGPLAGTASAHAADSGSLTFSGDPGEKISGGQSQQFTTDAGDAFDVSGARDENSVFVQVLTPDGNRWALNMAAPDGEKLTSGTTYTGALRWPYAGSTDSELNFSGTDRDCASSSTGSFTISNISFGPYGSVRALDATFEQYCDGSGLALRGEVHSVMPEPPAALALGLALDPQGTVPAPGGQPTVGGTVTCNKPAQVTVDGRLTQAQKRVTASNWFKTTVECTPGAPVHWTATPADSQDALPFQSGSAGLSATATADDRDYGVTVTTNQSTVIDLTRA
ncbi:hypothetical protein F0344_01820 [Streptomyces finlayi]|uniref:Ig-like domain-containing protein n=1 Tax=Streptomyces finlayi TaxID=67296 RepID=A0A7G7BDV2_9ACTN|nr:hypothetical protein [Streptomyces finlayi]QNE73517.1 hypothetical protein F0344_01820 [Streptomyces finlayi]